MGTTWQRCPGASQCYERDNLVLFHFILFPSGKERGERERKRERARKRKRKRERDPTEE